MQVDFAKVYGPDWTIIDLDTGEPIADLDDVQTADDETGEYTVVLFDAGRLTRPNAAGGIATETRKGRIKIVPPEVRRGNPVAEALREVCLKSRGES